MIRATDMFPIGDPSRYKLHLFHSPDDPIGPLEMFALDGLVEPSLKPWQAEYAVWERKRIFAMSQYGEAPAHWVFGGVFEVVECLPWRYVLEDCPEFRKFIGRAVIRFRRYPWMQGFAYRLEDHVDGFEVVEVLPSVSECLYERPMKCFQM
jgi:hypothetical protein